jgi:hypothetical protein
MLLKVVSSLSVHNSHIIVPCINNQRQLTCLYLRGMRCPKMAYFIVNGMLTRKGPWLAGSLWFPTKAVMLRMWLVPLILLLFLALRAVAWMPPAIRGPLLPGVPSTPTVLEASVTPSGPIIPVTSASPELRVGLVPTMCMVPLLSMTLLELLAPSVADTISLSPSLFPYEF